MNNVLDVFRNRPDKSISSLATIILSIFTIVMYQELTIPTLKELLDYIIQNERNPTMYITWFLNLLCLGSHITLGVVWIKDVFKDNYMDISSVTERVTSVIVGVFHLVYSIFFIDYILSSLLGIVVATIIIVIFMSNSGSGRRLHRQR